MKLKLDENLGLREAELFRAAGHDTATVHGQRMDGASDMEIIQRCRGEGRAIVTLDLDFSNPMLFRPSDYCGIAVLRAPRPVSSRALAVLCRTLIAGLAKNPLEGKLWIVERGRIRVHQQEQTG